LQKGERTRLTKGKRARGWRAKFEGGKKEESPLIGKGQFLSTKNTVGQVEVSEPVTIRNRKKSP